MTPTSRTLFFCLGLSHSLFAESHWIEGEDPSSSKVQHHGWYSSVKNDILSEGKWLSHYGNAPGIATYVVEIAEPGRYTFWARLNPVASKPHWQLNGDDWTPVPLKDLRGQQNIAADSKVDHRFLAWSKVAILNLKSGKNTVSFRWQGGASNSGGLDCFVLTSDPFVPQGKMKPGTSLSKETDAGPADAIWIEGEDADQDSMTRHPWYGGQVKKDVLSGGDWISNFSKTKEGKAGYQFEVITDDTYSFWVRCNPAVGAKLDWQLDSDDWQSVDFSDSRGQQNIAADNKPDLRFLAWTKVGKVKLTPGKHQINFRMNSGEKRSNHGGLDCFVFTRIPFVPAGKKRPSVSSAESGPADWFPLLPDDDTFDPKSVIDFSNLIPAPAGQFGPLLADGKDLRFSKADKPIKLWGVGANVQIGKYTKEQLTQRAKYLRKFGVNVVRQHPLFGELHTDGKIDPAKLDQYDWWFAELKKHGIYSDWSVFYYWKIRRDSGYPLFDDLDGTGDLRDTYGVITGAPELRKLRDKVLVELLNHKNPYTGLRYADDPALAIVEMQNEDSIFFWNPLGDLASPKPKRWPLHAKQLRQMFAAWVKKTYQTDEALKAAWGKLKRGDSVDADELLLMTPWELPGEGPRGAFAGQTKRAGDCIKFLAEMQRQQFEDCKAAIRSTGFKAVIMTTAWQVGGAATEAANIWTDTVGDMIDRHNYFGGGAGGHSITEGTVKNGSHLTQPGAGLFTMGMKQVESKPFCVTEWTQLPPNQWKIESAPLMAFYGLGLQGWDASFHFAQAGTRLGDGWPRMTSYASDTPAYAGQFPALAFALHHGHIKEAPVVAARRLSKNDLFTGTDILKQDSTKGGYDAKTMIVDGGTPLEALAIGRVTVDFQGGETSQTDFSKFWNQKSRVVQSATEELEWDYGKELVTVRTPKTQAVIGKTHQAEIKLPDVALTFKTDFVSTIFTPLDNLPLAESKRILITALARDKQSGSHYSADGKTLEAVGTAPLLLEPVQATIKIAGAKPTKITPCDHYGTPMKKTVPVSDDGTFTIDGRYRAYYYEVIR